MLMAILNAGKARSSNVKMDQPNTKFASNWHFTEFFRIFLLIFFVKLSIYGHVWWKFESLNIILKEDHNCIISLKFGSNIFFNNFCIFLSNVLFSVMVAAMFDGG